MNKQHYHYVSIHSGKKAYQCEFCGKEFSRKYSLTIHHKIHTGVRDYKCDICQRGFRAAIYLQEHRRVHTGEKPFLCEICSRGFRIKSDMIRHRLNVHFKGHKGTVIVKRHQGDEQLEGVEVVEEFEDEGSDDNETDEAHYVTITTKNEAGEDVEETPGHQTMHQLVFLSETEAILV